MISKRALTVVLASLIGVVGALLTNTHAFANDGGQRSLRERGVRGGAENSVDSPTNPVSIQFDGEVVFSMETGEMAFRGRELTVESVQTFIANDIVTLDPAQGGRLVVSGNDYALIDVNQGKAEFFQQADQGNAPKAETCELVATFEGAKLHFTCQGTCPDAKSCKVDAILKKWVQSGTSSGTIRVECNCL